MANLEKALAAVDEKDVVVVQVAIMQLALRSLIATHPNPARFREVMLEEFALHQAQPVMLSASQPVCDLARALVEHLTATD